MDYQSGVVIMLIHLLIPSKQSQTKLQIRSIKYWIFKLLNLIRMCKRKFLHRTFLWFFTCQIYNFFSLYCLHRKFSQSHLSLLSCYNNDSAVKYKRSPTKKKKEHKKLYNLKTFWQRWRTVTRTNQHSKSEWRCVSSVFDS